MKIDWTLLAPWPGPILAAFVGAAIARFVEKKPKLIAYVKHSSAVTVHPPNSQPADVHTHSVVVRNAGRQTANNVRLGHQFLPDFSVYPSIRYEVSDLPAGGKEIVFPFFVPGDEATITYLYFPPVLWSGINTHVKSDEGFAQILNVLPTPQLPAWQQLVFIALFFLGVSAAIYLLSQGVLLLSHLVGN